MTEMEKAREGVKSAEARLMDVMRLSTRALVKAGFFPTRVTDPARLSILREIADEAPEETPAPPDPSSPSPSDGPSTG